MPNSIGDDLQDAMNAAWQAKGQIATLILPMDFQAQQIQDLGKKFHVVAPQRHFVATQVEAVAKQYQQANLWCIIVGDTGVNERA